jgi:hypothetical protein
MLTKLPKVKVMRFNRRLFATTDSQLGDDQPNKKN